MEEEIEQDVPVIPLDYMGKKAEDEKSRRIESSQIFVGINRRDKGVFAHMVPKKGVGAHAVEMIGREINLIGYSKIILKSGQEPATRELIEAVKRERSEKFETQCEEHSVGEEQWEVESAIQYTQAQFRTTR